MNTPQEPCQVNNNDSSLTVYSEVNHGSSNTFIRSALKRGWSSTAKRLAWRKGHKKKTSKSVTLSRASIINSNEKINSGNIVTCDNGFSQHTQPVSPENYTQDSSLSSSSNYYDNNDQSYNRRSFEPLFNESTLYNSSVFDDYEDVEVVFEPNCTNFHNNNSRKNIKIKECLKKDLLIQLKILTVCKSFKYFLSKNPIKFNLNISKLIIHVFFLNPQYVNQRH